MSSPYYGPWTPGDPSGPPPAPDAPPNAEAMRAFDAVDPSTLDDFVQEVANARVYDGVHFRNSTEVGTALGKQVGALAVARLLRRSD